MTRVCSLVVAMVIGAVSGAAAQEQDVIFFRAGPPPADAGQGGAGNPLAPVFFERPIDVMLAEPFDVGNPVTGAPYSADITTEIVQVLADGNRIERRSTSSVARDGQGRVRRTQALAAIGPLLPQGDVDIVTINDPVARVHYSLDAHRKVAVQSPPTFNRRVDGPVPGRALPARPPEAQGRPQNVRTEPLGSRDIEGVTAEGTQSVVTIPAGTIGNQAPIEIVSERWFSPDLQAVVLSRRSDPRFGETTYRLERIVRAEPPPELFQVPSDYTVESGPPFGAGVRIERRLER